MVQSKTLIVSGSYGTMYSVIVQCNVCTILFVCSTWAEAQQSALRVILSKKLYIKSHILLEEVKAKYKRHFWVQELLGAR